MFYDYLVTASQNMIILLGVHKKIPISSVIYVIQNVRPLWQRSSNVL